ncbi:SMC-Scp complex subunit ScpB [Glycomyces sp. TRM65418]|uniref:SMC-Scp complex subunit ScpB n=1 Tax=Glycomyces sp. TRM65418 TaxID=2867006 RepID=UPI001CE69F17|nr:SMC-Scp complex subunit ScpB [Glycomyces sp. TRM65418]MCC3761525.1 SMC-Scp complex subunit ScpB [Glycomyces sp. TRM65418]QZD55623.1 SMC-Scp complex subunit ScpB [Glycomyces sp. TRM65418]
MSEHLRADEVAEWRPPWQRREDGPRPPEDAPVRPDTPADEPVDDTDEYARAVSAKPEPEDPDDADDPASDSIPVPEDVDLGAVLEAILMIAEEPLTEDFLSSVLDRPRSQVREELGRLSAEYTGDGRGFDLRRQAGGWRFYSRAEYAPYVERFVTDGASARLTKAALETLAVVAYRQPVTRGRISAIRGVNCDGVIRTLLARGLVEECGTDPDSTATLYRTTTLFLEKIGLDSVDQLPELAPFLPDDVTDIEEDEQR